MSAWVIGYLITAALSGSIGYLLGAVFSMSKVEELRSRLDANERDLIAQRKVVGDFGEALRLVLLEMDGGVPRPETIARAQSMIAAG